MALLVKNLEAPDGSIFPEAYVRVQSISVANVDYEYLEPIPDSDDLITKWITKVEASSTLYVYADAIARNNRVTPVHWFSVEFSYDKSIWENVFEQVYKRVKTIYPEAEDC
jgi:hypothetical protein